MLSQRVGHLQKRWQVQICQLKLLQKVLSRYLNYPHVSVLSSISTSLNCGNKTVAIHKFRKLNSNARFYMKKAPWGCCVLVFDSSGERAAHPRSFGSGVPGGCGTETEVGHTTSFDEGANVTLIPSMEILSSRCQKCICVRRDLGRLTYLLCFKSNWGRCRGAPIRGRVH